MKSIRLLFSLILVVTFNSLSAQTYNGGQIDWGLFDAVEAKTVDDSFKFHANIISFTKGKDFFKIIGSENGRNFQTNFKKLEGIGAQDFNYVDDNGHIYVIKDLTNTSFKRLEAINTKPIPDSGNRYYMTLIFHLD